MPVSVPKTCLAAVFVGAGRPLELQEFSIPQPGSNEAIVRVECATLCGSDLHTISGRRPEPQPSILGHEALGEIVAVGEPAPKDLNGVSLELGDRVIWSPIIACHECNRCRQGFTQKCLHLRKYGHELAEGDRALSGGLAEYIVLQPGSSIVRLDLGLSSNVFCPASCATATVAAAFRAAGAVADQNVLIFGAGLLGLTAAAIARYQQARSVTLVDVDHQRLARAKLFGADDAVCVENGSLEYALSMAPGLVDRSFQIVMEMSGSASAVEASLSLADIAGRIVLVGSVKPSRPISLDPESIVRGWLSIHGIHNYAPEDLQTAVEFLRVAGNLYPFDDLVAAQFSLDRINEAVSYAVEQRPVRIKILPGSK